MRRAERFLIDSLPVEALREALFDDHRHLLPA